VVVTESVLFVLSGSAVAALTVTVSVSVAGVAGAVVTIVIAGWAPVGAVARVHVTTEVAWVHAQPAPVAETNETPAGSVFTTVTEAEVLGPAFVTSTVYVSVAPRMTGSGETVTATPRSALAVTADVVVVLLFARFGSTSVAVTVAAFERVPACAGASAVIVIVEDVPLASEARVHVTSWPVALHAQPVPVAEPNVTPAGSVSVTLRFVAVLAPLFVMTSEYVSEPVAITGFGATLELIATSARGVTVVVAEPVLSAGEGSFVAAPIVALDEIDGTSPGTVHATVIAGAAPTASVARVQETLAPVMEHVQPVPLAVGLVHPAGSVWLTVTDAAVDGPVFVELIVYVITPPAKTGSGESPIAIAGSALPRNPLRNPGTFGRQARGAHAGPVTPDRRRLGGWQRRIAPGSGTAPAGPDRC